MPYIKDELSTTSAAFFVLTETWLTTSHLAAEIHISGYSVFRQDRQRRRVKSGRDSGGVAVYIRDDCAIGAEVVFNFSNGVIDSLAITLPALDQVLILTYRSPDANVRGIDCHRSTNKELDAYLNQLRRFLSSLPSPTPNIIMMGDYNLPHANWTTG